MNPKFSQFTTTELLKKKKATSLLTDLLAGMLIVLLVMAILLAADQKLIGYSLIAVALSLSLIVFVNFNSIKKINAELLTRQ